MCDWFRKLAPLSRQIRFRANTTNHPRFPALQASGSLSSHWILVTFSFSWLAVVIAWVLDSDSRLKETLSCIFLSTFFLAPHKREVVEWGFGCQGKRCVFLPVYRNEHFFFQNKLLMFFYFSSLNLFCITLILARRETLQGCKRTA